MSSNPGNNVSVALKPRKKRKKGTWQSLVQQKYLYLMSMPFVIWLFVFNYVPVWGWTMAFQNYKPAKSFTDQKWV
ncbi:MAG: sugar ABC transporter permease, partial [Paenibacillus macerans]|nr:sugar ABC transporter permease [Paenibacillus macerans]